MERLTNVESIQKTIQLINDKGYDLIAVKPLTAHPDDFYLNIILVDRKTEIEPYVCWLHNTYDKDGLHEGHYYNNLTSALARFNNKK
jgi:hypothetical protein